MSIPFLDLGAAYVELKSEIDEAIARVVSTGPYILGPEVEAFEQAFARYTDSTYAIGVANGLDSKPVKLNPGLQSPVLLNRPGYQGGHLV